MSESFDLEKPDFFTAGAVGNPGERVFYLQARGDGPAHHAQVREGAGARARRIHDRPHHQAGRAQGQGPTDLDLLPFAEPAWIIATLGVGYDEEHGRIIVDAHELFEEEEEGQRAGEEPASARVRITREQAQAFVERAKELMKGGRPPCPVCSGPMDPAGHVCPRSNGHVVH